MPTTVPCICDNCHISFEMKLQNYNLNIKRGCLNNYCSPKCCTEAKRNKQKCICKQCGCEFLKSLNQIKKFPNNFCNRTCSALFNNKNRKPSEETKKRVSESLIKFYNSIKKTKPIKILIENTKPCIVCNTKFTPNKTKNNKFSIRRTCSTNCQNILHSKSGKVSASKRQKRSKDEISLYNLCSKYFTKVEHNKIIVDGWDADIIINDNYLILWNGPWHYMNIKMKGVSLHQIQNRDYIKINKFIDMGYNVYIYEDRYFTPEKAFLDLKDNINDKKDAGEKIEFSMSNDGAL